MFGIPDQIFYIIIGILAGLLGGKPLLKGIASALKAFPITTGFGSVLEKIAGNGNGNGHDKTPEWAAKLTEHYNEETTAELKKLNTTMEFIKDENIKHHTFEEGKFELLEKLLDRR